MQRKFKVTIGFLVLAGLAACSNATPPPPTPPLTPTPTPTPTPELVTPTAPNYVTMNDTRFISVPVSGSVFYNRDGVGQLIGPDSVSGRYTTSDGTLILSIGGVEFVTKSGGGGRLILDSNGALAGVSTARIVDYGPEYQYVKSIYVKGPTETTNGVTITPNWFGSIGIVTAPADMPAAGSATFAGGAALNYVGGQNVALPGQKLLLQLGTSAITADFASGTANVDMAFSSSYQLEYSLPYYYLKVTRVSGTGLQINGNGLSGGNWAALGGNVSVSEPLPSTSEVPVDMVGRVLATTTAADTTTLASSGSFYGYDSASSGPAELTGRVMVDGYTTDSLGVISSDGQADYTYWAIRQP